MSTNEPTDAEVIADAIMLSGPVRVQVVNVGTMTGFMRRESAEFLGHRVAAALSAWAIHTVITWSFSEDQRRQHAIRRLTRQAQRDRELRRGRR